MWSLSLLIVENSVVTPIAWIHGVRGRIGLVQPVLVEMRFIKSSWLNETVSVSSVTGNRNHNQLIETCASLCKLMFGILIE